MSSSIGPWGRRDSGRRGPGGDAAAAPRPADRLQEVADNELSPAELERLLAHVAECPECHDELERLRRMKALLQRSCRQEVAPAALRERISVAYRRVTVTSADGTTRVTTEQTQIRRH
ncbi:zf-HC2 domain-containing protein [Brachybacterium sp. EF45031]|uniref:zf-HC2 domain-containing protein n=1 Tax=Brachybacterium sillae TaxID=2810536 RepID=UPI00217E7599|nr:zf-HC2 domain-containing protein [Brachybacterium sillae]MCS6710939.1 zf-HC2 domain-containing protein [Brachybacterium sillae]